MTSFRKIVVTEFGDVDVLEIVNSVCPPPPPRHAQIKTHYSGFTGADINMRKGIYHEQKPAPFTPGYSLVGTVSQLGDTCSALQVGDVVAVLSMYDAQSEYVNFPERSCVKVLAGLELKQVTALVCDWSTAYAMVKETAMVTVGQRVFIHGISGGVGTGLMILCKLQGAQVYGTASLRNHELVHSYGAHPFVYTDKKWMEAMTDMGGADVVFDALGFESFDESYNILKPRGILVAYGNNGDSLAGATPRNAHEDVMKLYAMNEKGGKRTTFYGLTKDNSSYVNNMNSMMSMLKKGEVTVPIKKVWQLDEIWDAHKAWNSGTGIGSVVIQVSQD